MTNDRGHTGDDRVNGWTWAEVRIVGVLLGVIIGFLLLMSALVPGGLP